MPLPKAMNLSSNEYSSILYPQFDLPVQLKYLDFSSHLPKRMVDNLVILESLHVRSNKTVLIPPVIIRMAKLRNFLVKPIAGVEAIISFWIYTRKDEDLLRHLPHLQNLKCICGSGLLFPDTSFLAELKSLNICFEISLRGIKVPNFNFPSTMEKLCLSGAVVTGAQMSIIGQLPELKVLKLENHVFVGDEWEVSCRTSWQVMDYYDDDHYDDDYDIRGRKLVFHEFKELRVLKIESRDLRVWSCDNSVSFRKLECLVLTGCAKLEEIPKSLWQARVEVMKCGLGAYLSLARIKSECRVGDVATDVNLEQVLLQDIELHDQETVDTSSEEVQRYLKKHAPGYNPDTFKLVEEYVMHFNSNLDDHREFHDVMMGLGRIALSYRERKDRLRNYSCRSYEMEKKQGEFSELFVNSFIPKVQKLFKVLKLHQLSDKDKHLTRNEILAASLSILIQVLHRQENKSWAEEEQLYALLRNQLSFHLSVLGDIPFKLTHSGLEEQVNNLLGEFEMLANEVGSFMLSYVFSIHHVDADWFHAETNSLLVKAEFLNAKIKHHCNEFSELPISFISRSTVIDSFFIIDSLIGDIENLENNEINFTDDDEKLNQVGMLKGELNTSKILIKVTDQILRATEANEQKEVLIQIRDLAYQAEYLINSYGVGNIPTWYLNLRLPSIIQKIQTDNKRLQQLVKKMQGSNITTNASDGKKSSGTRDNHATSMDHSDLVTFNIDLEKKILEDLLKRSMPSRMIISIYGMPGLGKTTTATKLYNCLESSEHFDRRAWCVISQEYSLKALFVQILRDIAPDNDKILGKETAELGLSIHQILIGRRYLIVLDDVWDSSVLEKLMRYLPDEENGSRVVVTSRVKDVAPDDSIFHTLPLLSNDQCWDLLKKKVFPKESCPWELDGIGRQISEKCCGIPLAVVTTAGILANLEKERSLWESVGKRLDVLLLDDDQNNYRNILELSYEHLPRNIKPCFLYFASFPEDAEISKKMLIWMWISERFIPEDENRSPEEIAETYLLDLINRSLVLPAGRGSNGRIKACKIHDLLHDICVAKAHEQNFIKSTDVFSIYEKHQGLYLPSASNIIVRPFGLHCRSFRDVHTYQSSYLQTMALLKTVELPPDKYDKYPRFYLPIQLRYLSTGVLKKVMVANLLNLEFIRVRSQWDVYVPSVVLRMVKLRHLDVRKKAVFEQDCSNITETTNLRSLSYVHINGKKDEDILRHSPHLQKLKCICGGKLLYPNNPDRLTAVVKGEMISPDLSALVELETLRINYYSNSGGDILLLEGSFPSTIKKLCLNGCKLPWEKMSIIGKLPKLQVLKLEFDAFMGDEWETNDDEFQELRFLKIYSHHVKEWRSESSHFPRLEQLVMRLCVGLQEIPSDLGYIQSLQRIVVEYCGEGARLSAEEIKNEQRDNGNTQLQVHTG